MEIYIKRDTKSGKDKKREDGRDRSEQEKEEGEKEEESESKGTFRILYRREEGERKRGREEQEREERGREEGGESAFGGLVSGLCTSLPARYSFLQSPFIVLLLRPSLAFPHLPSSPHFNACTNSSHLYCFSLRERERYRERARRV